MLVEVDENLINKTAQVMSKDYIHISVIEDIKSEIEHIIPCDKEALSVKLGVLEIIDKHISGKENSDADCN